MRRKEKAIHFRAAETIIQGRARQKKSARRNNGCTCTQERKVKGDETEDSNHGSRDFVIKVARVDAHFSARLACLCVCVCTELNANKRHNKAIKPPEIRCARSLLFDLTFCSYFISACSFQTFSS